MFHNLIARFICLALLSSSGENTFELPLQEPLVHNGRKDSSESRSERFRATQPRSGRIVVASTAIAISLRILLSGLVLDNVQCSVASLEVGNLLSLNVTYADSYQGYVPLLLAIYDYWYIQRRRPKSDGSRATPRTFKNFTPIIFLTAAYSVMTSVMGAPRSTYICPLSSKANTAVPFMQVLIVLLDCYVLVRISAVASAANLDVSSKINNPSVVLARIFLVNM